MMPPSNILAPPNNLLPSMTNASPLNQVQLSHAGMQSQSVFATNQTTRINMTNANSASFYPQLMYCCPTPPGSPSSALYFNSPSIIHQPTIIILRGVPSTVNVQDVLKFLTGFPEVLLFGQPKILFQIVIKCF